MSSSPPTVEQLNIEHIESISYHPTTAEEIWNGWRGRKAAKVTLLFDILCCWTLLLVNTRWYILSLASIFFYSPLLLLAIIVPWNSSVYQLKCCRLISIDSETIIRRFDESINEYMNSTTSFNRYTILRSYRCYSFLFLFFRLIWFIHYYQTLVVDSVVPPIAFFWYVILIIMPLIQSIFIWQFCNNIAKNYMERGLQQS